MAGSAPQLSNIYPELQTLLETRATNTNKPYTLGGVSGLSTWIRVISTAGNGMVMESIHSPESFNTRYGDSNGPGVLGYQLDMKTPVKVSGRALRPSPVITSLSIDETTHGASRTIKFSITCFTKEQLDELAKYYFEPGFHTLVEFGWNVNDAWSQRVGGGGPISVCDVAFYDNFSYIKNKRVNSNFQYDALLGINAGGGVSFGDNETYTMDVKIVGVGNIAEYAQTHRGSNPTTTASNKSNWEFKPYDIEQFAKNPDNLGMVLYMQMYNQLPLAKKNEALYNLHTNKKWADPANFVNFDESVSDYLLEWLSSEREIRNKTDKTLTIPKDIPLFSKDRFIRLELAFEILNEMNVFSDPYNYGSCKKKTRDLRINISNTAITAFPNMFSTDKGKMFIPNPQAPNFNLIGALTQPEEGDEDIQFINFENIGSQIANIHPKTDKYEGGDKHAELNGSTHDPATGQSRLTPYAFPSTYKIGTDVRDYTQVDSTFINIEEDEGWWGWLKNLYVNFDFFVECLEKPNFVVRDVAYEILNGLSSACNSIWKFQILDRPACPGGGIKAESGDMILEVVDLNFLGKVKDVGIAEFQARGTKSPFISADFSVDTPGAMMSSVVQQKYSKGKTAGSPELNPMPQLGSVFSDELEDQVGTILYGIKIESAKKAEEDRVSKLPPETQRNLENAKARQGRLDKKAELEAAKTKTYELFTKKAGVFSMVQDRNGKIDITDTFGDVRGGNNTVIEDLLMVGTWNDPSALRQVQLINLGKVSGAPSNVKTKDGHTKNPPIGLAKFNFKVHGVSGFKVGDQLRITDLPEKFGHPNFYQVTKVNHSISAMTWTTEVECLMRLMPGVELKTYE